MPIRTGESINGTTRNVLTKKEFERKIYYGVCPQCGDWRIIRVRGGHLKENPLTGERKWISSGFYYVCGSVEDEPYDVQKMHYTLKPPHKKSPAYEYIGT